MEDTEGGVGRGTGLTGSNLNMRPGVKIEGSKVTVFTQSSEGAGDHIELIAEGSTGLEFYGAEGKGEQIASELKKRAKEQGITEPNALLKLAKSISSELEQQS